MGFTSVVLVGEHGVVCFFVVEPCALDVDVCCSFFVI